MLFNLKLCILCQVLELKHQENRLTLENKCWKMGPILVEENKAKLNRNKIEFAISVSGVLVFTILFTLLERNYKVCLIESICQRHRDVTLGNPNIRS